MGDGETVRSDESAAAQAADPHAPPSSAGSEAAKLLQKASPWRFAARAAIVVAVLVALGVGGYLGYRGWQAHEVRSAPMVAFAADTVRIGNNFRGREGYRPAVEERPAHAVKVAAFELDVHEVTVDLYSVCVEQGGCEEPPKGELCTWGRLDFVSHPINCVTHEEAEQFCKWAGKRLPTEVEWEYAAGGSGAKRLFPWGRKLPGPGHANVCGIECRHGAQPSSDTLNAMFDFDDGAPATAPVGSFADGDTEDGLKDMAGNVWEWTSSYVCRYPEHECPATPERIIRGGGWTHRHLLSPEVTTREKLLSSERSEGIGFRCAR